MLRATKILAIIILINTYRNGWSNDGMLYKEGYRTTFTEVWTSLIGEELVCTREPENAIEGYTIAVGYLPRSSWRYVRFSLEEEAWWAAWSLRIRTINLFVWIYFCACNNLVIKNIHVSKFRTFNKAQKFCYSEKAKYRIQVYMLLSYSLIHLAVSSRDWKRNCFFLNVALMSSAFAFSGLV